jgi:tRNA modification GTPase
MENSRDTFAVLLTPRGRGAVSTILVTGSNALVIVASMTHRAPDDFQPWGRIRYARWLHADGEDVVVTAQDLQQVEIHCHGGVAAAQCILNSLSAAGCQLLDWKAWRQRNEIDPFRAAAQVALASARTERTASILLDQYQGALRNTWRQIDRSMKAGDTAIARKSVERLLRWAPLGLHLTEPWKVVLAGPPNVGKSSLLNALLGYQRAIVVDQPGTTRDVVHSQTNFCGWPVQLSDTAGMGDAHDPLEQAGVELAKGATRDADLVLYLFESQSSWTTAQQLIIGERSNHLIVYSKCDLGLPAIDGRPIGLSTSTITGEGILDLQQMIAQRLVPMAPALGEAVPFTSTQVACLQMVLADLDRQDTASAQRALRALGAD